MFTFYLIICCILLLKIPIVRKSGLSQNEILGLFLFKISVGVLLGIITAHYSPLNDYSILNDDGIKENNLLLSDPTVFFKSILYSPYQDKYGGFFNSVGSYWNDLRNNIIIKILAIVNLITRGNYYINSVFFNLFGFIGHIALFRIFSSLYPVKKLFIIIGCFFIPTTMYFSSGIHKDLIVFASLGLFCYGLYFSVAEKFSIKRTTLLIVSFILIMLMRNYLAAALIPCSIAFYISQKTNWEAKYVFTSVFAIGFLTLLLLEILWPFIQPIKIISQKQHDFLALHRAASQISLTELQPSLKSLLLNFPEAFNHGFLRPYLWESGGKFTELLSIELFSLNLLALWVLITQRESIGKIRPFIAFGICLCFVMFLFTGYIVPNTSSILRYKSLYLPFIITPVLCSFNWKNIGTITHYII